MPLLYPYHLHLIRTYFLLWLQWMCWVSSVGVRGGRDGWGRLQRGRAPSLTESQRRADFHQLSSVVISVEISSFFSNYVGTLCKLILSDWEWKSQILFSQIKMKQLGACLKFTLTHFRSNTIHSYMLERCEQNHLAVKGLIYFTLMSNINVICLYTQQVGNPNA